MKKKPKQGDYIEVQWLDTFNLHGWWETDNLFKKAKEKLILINSVGVFVGTDKNWLIMATNDNPDDDFSRWGHPIWIPNGCIKQVKIIK